jgi:hypothetical protein
LGQWGHFQFVDHFCESLAAGGVTPQAA